MSTKTKLIPGRYYDFRAEDVVYRNARMVGEDRDGYWIHWGFARVFIAKHEFIEAVPLPILDESV